VPAAFSSEGGGQHGNCAVGQQFQKDSFTRSQKLKVRLFLSPLQPVTLCWSHRSSHQTALPTEAMARLGVLLQPGPTLGNQAASVSHVSCGHSADTGT